MVERDLRRIYLILLALTLTTVPNLPLRCLIWKQKLMGISWLPQAAGFSALLPLFFLMSIVAIEICYLGPKF